MIVSTYEKDMETVSKYEPRDYDMPINKARKVTMKKPIEPRRVIPNDDSLTVVG